MKGVSGGRWAALWDAGGDPARLLDGLRGALWEARAGRGADSRPNKLAIWVIGTPPEGQKNPRPSVAL